MEEKIGREFNSLKEVLENLFLEVYNANDAIPDDAVCEQIGKIILAAKLKIPSASTKENVESVFVPKKMAQLMGFSEEELLGKIKANPKYPIVFYRGGPMLIVSQIFDDNPPGVVPFGAAGLFYRGIVEEAIKLLGSDHFYIIPSSKVELMLVKCSDFDDPGKILKIVLDVNKVPDAVPPELVLGDFLMEYKDGQFLTVEF